MAHRVSRNPIRTPLADFCRRAEEEAEDSMERLRRLGPDAALEPLEQATRFLTVTSVLQEERGVRCPEYEDAYRKVQRAWDRLSTWLRERG